jgi:RNA polymerase sigma factor (sigma-70 family)
MQKGRKEDFARIYEAYLPYAYFVVQHTYHDKHDADDIVQEAFVSAYDNIRKLRKPEAFSSWFGRILCTTVAQAARKSARVSAWDDEAMSELPEINDELLPESSYESREKRQQVMDAVNALPTKQRLCVFAFYFQRLNIADIAESQQTSDNAVKNALYHARLSLEQKLAPTMAASAFTVPIGFVFDSEYNAFSVAVGLAEALWSKIVKLIKPVPFIFHFIPQAGVAGTVANIAAVSMIAIGAAPIAVEVTDQTRSYYNERSISDLSDMIGEDEAAMLDDLCADSDKSRDGELTSLLDRARISPDISCWIPNSTNAADTFRLEKQDKRLYVIRISTASGEYMLSYRFEPSLAPELGYDEIERMLGGAI